MLATSLNLLDHDDILTILMTLPLLPEGRFQDGFAEAERLGHALREECPYILKQLSTFRADWLPHNAKLMFDDENNDYYKLLRIYESKLTVMFESEELMAQWKFFGI